ncbi:MAG: glucose-6-phosphate dehydrogenase, partial [Planctomycetota bacterium]
MAHTIVIFGASGDLTSRKLIPALYSLFGKGRLPENTRIVGVSRSEFSHDAWRADLEQTSRKYLDKEFDEASWRDFAARIYYQAGDIQQASDFAALAVMLNEIEEGQRCTRLYYLSTSPHLYPAAVEALGSSGLADESNGERRIVVEKPFGTDLATAESLNKTLHGVFKERQVYRID